MLPKAKRLTTELFTEIIEKGRSFHGNFLIVRVIPTHSTQETSRFAVSVPKKVSKTAVGRNKLKRQVYVAIGRMEKNLKPNINVVIILKVGADKLKYKEIESEIGKVFVKSGILK